MLPSSSHFLINMGCCKQFSSGLDCGSVEFLLTHLGTVSLSVLIAPRHFICLFIFEVSSTWTYFISEPKFQPLHVLQNQIKLQIILFWKLSVICNCKTDMGKKHPNFKPFVMNPYLLCEIRMSVFIPWNQMKKNGSCSYTGYDTNSIRHWGV